MKKLYKSIFFVTAVLAVSTVFAQKSVEVTNGGFELGLEDGSWAFEANDGAIAEFDIEENDVKEGNSALIVFSDELGANDWSTQIFNRTWNVEANKSYRLSLWFKDVTRVPENGYSESDTMKVSFTCGHGITYVEYGRVSYVVLPDQEWTEISVVVTPPMTTDGVNEVISMSTHFVGTGAVIVDNFTVTEIQVLDAVVAEDLSKVSVNFATDMADPSADLSAFSLMVNGTAVEISSVAVGVETHQVDIIPTETLPASGKVEVVYASGNLATSNGIKIDDFSMVARDGEVSVIQPELKNFNLYPNPVNGFLNLQSDVAITNVEIFNIAGQSVYTVDGENISHITLPTVEPGVYLLSATGVDGSLSTKRIVCK